MKKLFIIAALLAVTIGASACNTMEGLGQDIKKGGENLSEAAESNK